MGKKFLTLSFDDGTVQDVRFVKLLNDYGIKCTFNLNSGLFGTKHHIIHEGIKCDHSEITADMVKTLYEGHEVAVHTVTHPNLRELKKDEILKEVLEDQKALERLCGYPIVGMAYPGGGNCFNELVIQTILQGTTIRYARTTDCHYTFKIPQRLMAWQPTCHQNDPQLISLAEQFIQSKEEEDLLFYIWGHSFEFDKRNSWDNFERFCALIAGKDDITYATNREVASYIENGSHV